MDTPAIDVHAHFGVHVGSAQGLTNRLMSADGETVARRAAAVGIEKSVVSAMSALGPYRGDPLRGNEEARLAAEAHAGLFFWAVLDPLVEKTSDQVKDLLGHQKCCGIKIHPHQHSYEIRDHGERIFDFAAAHEAVVISHSGCPGSYPEDFVPFADRYPAVRLILAHLGHSDDENVSRQVHALLRSRAGNIFVDTSSQCSIFCGLIEWAVTQIPVDRILFGTDHPCYSPAAQKARIVYADIPDDAKQAILHENAAQLLGN